MAERCSVAPVKNRQKRLYDYQLVHKPSSQSVDLHFASQNGPRACCPVTPPNASSMRTHDRVVYSVHFPSHAFQDVPAQTQRMRKSILHGNWDVGRLRDNGFNVLQRHSERVNIRDQGLTEPMSPKEPNVKSTDICAGVSTEVKAQYRIQCHESREEWSPSFQIKPTVAKGRRQEHPRSSVLNYQRRLY
ncbi:hypothetical protein EXIGLDRAFT_698972 [Exidia glandulosa HHB12029]|uniref:Uncharacterized protein n=1 Tax=Exidia glandulosa HHB12029 TaxID=1314781 RepID=A0A165E0W7_EXIGL|nr:hypothetical protein EXIGLDRAFT_698972 [Exidia glandulosa HHB12029]